MRPMKPILEKVGNVVSGPGEPLVDELEVLLPGIICSKAVAVLSAISTFFMRRALSIPNVQ